MTDGLQEKAVRVEPGRSVEEKAAELIPELRPQAEASEAAEADEDFSSADAAPARASEGVAAHEKEMRRRGFEKAGPPPE